MQPHGTPRGLARAPYFDLSAPIMPNCARIAGRNIAARRAQTRIEKKSERVQLESGDAETPVNAI